MGQKLLAYALVAFIVLTQPNGNRIWFVPSQIVAVYKAPRGTCADEGTAVLTLFGQFCVKERPEEIISKMEKVKL